ncbi:hypothetical protein SK128_000078 [Halocaridina rubra]|uniref:Single domain-containing protein n=1 Tax=Halocaridina rubra TaxID=373956 RepID=A0AAN8WSK3_HALRR
MFSMRHQIGQFLGLMTVITIASASVAVGPSPVNPDFPLDCWSQSQQKNFPEGASWAEPNCLQVTCTGYQNQLYLLYTSCSRIGVPPGCKTIQDMTLPYPACCPRPSCSPKL